MTKKNNADDYILMTIDRDIPSIKPKKVTSKGEDAAVYDVEKNKSNKYASVNRHLINKLKG